MKLFTPTTILATLAATQVAAQTQEPKQLFHVTVPKTIFDTALNQFGNELDVWKVSGDATAINADIYATETSINKFYATPQSKSLRTTRGAPLIQVERDSVNTAQLLVESAATTAACTARTARRLKETATGNYVDHAFFDCWRTADAIFGFFDQLVSENPSVFSKIDQVSTTFEGRSIPGYKLSTGPGKKAVFVQSLIHSREWHSGTAVFYTVASLLDGLRNKDADLTAVVDKYDWYFVPILNLDGFLYTHNPSGDRLWRKNRRPTVYPWNGLKSNGIDLNRNFGPKEFFDLDESNVFEQTYTGTAPLSEPETAGLYTFLKSLPLVGLLDIHTYGGYVLRPLGNQPKEAPEPFGSKLKVLCDSIKQAVEVNNTYIYKSQTIDQLYPAYGTILDSIFLEFNHTATISIEVEGDDFIQPESVIRPSGQHVFQGIVQFAKGLEEYYRGL